MEVLVKEKKGNEQISEFSNEYSTIRTYAEQHWPNWKKIYYNESFATSLHAKKLDIDDKK